MMTDGVAAQDNPARVLDVAELHEHEITRFEVGHHGIPATFR